MVEQTDNKRIRPQGDQTAATNAAGSRSDSDAVHARREYIRTKILHEHLQAALRDAPPNTVWFCRTPYLTQTLNAFLQMLPQSLAVAAALNTLATPDGEDTRTLGGISSDDLNNLSPVPLPVEFNALIRLIETQLMASKALSPRLCRKLEHELRKTLLSVADYWSAGDGSSTCLPVHFECLKC